jgi:hypothetical protein
MVNTSIHLPLKYSWKGHCHCWCILVSMYGGMAWIPFHLGSKKSGIVTFCCNLNLGLATKAKACKGAGQEGSPGVTFHAPWSVGECDGMNLHTPKWAPTLGVRVPMDSQIFKEWLQKSKPIWLKSSLYHWKSLKT